jgi:integrase
MPRTLIQQTPKSLRGIAVHEVPLPPLRVALPGLTSCPWVRCRTLLGELHVDIHVIQRILGHAQVTTTRIYTDPTDPLTREAADRIGELLWPGEGD